MYSRAIPMSEFLIGVNQVNQKSNCVHFAVN